MSIQSSTICWILTFFVVFFSRWEIYRQVEKLRSPSITPRLCRSRYQASQRLTSEAVRLSAVHERGFWPTCEVKTGIFDPRTTFCRPGTSRFPLINCYPGRYWYSFVAIFSFFFLATKNTRQMLHLQHPWNPRQSLLYYYSSISFLITLRFVRLRPVLITGDASWFYFLFKIP